MSFDPSTAPYLKPWLVRTLEPICDAEPGALADYILALLKHNAPESDMRKELIAQLDEFLEKECAPFIDTLFTVLRTKSYLPYGVNATTSSYPLSGSSSLDTGIPIPLDALLSPSSERPRKRSIDNDERNGGPSAKGPRLSAEGQFSRYSNGRNDSRSTGGWGGHRDRNERQETNGQGPSMSHQNGRPPQPYRPPEMRRGICRDYHNNGYCSRGALCKYSHGDDAVVPGQLFPAAAAAAAAAISPFMSMFPTGPLPFPMGLAGPASTYDPHESRMDMRSQGAGIGPGSRIHSRAPILPRMQHEDGSQPSGELPVIQDLTPHVEGSHQSNASPGVPSSGSMDGASADAVMNPLSWQTPPSPMVGVMPIFDQVTPHMNGQTSFRGGARGGRGRGEINNHGGVRPDRSNNKTLVVEKIPEDKLTRDALLTWFKQFGTVTEAAIDGSSAKALVSFSTNAEAHAAWKSEDAVLGNRFVKLFWHRPMGGHGQVGARMLAASAPLVASMSAQKPAPTTTVVTPQGNPTTLTTSTTVTPRKAPSNSVSLLAAKQRLLEQQIAEQKRLMGLLETVSPGEKKEIMVRLRQLGEEMKLSSSSTASATTPENPPTSSPRPDDREKKEKERLDKELELHHATVAVGGEAEESTEDLKTKLEKLKAEAASLGISDAIAEPTYGGFHRPYRGRGRGSRGFHRGMARGGMRGSMKLDNRPKKLLIKGVASDGIQAVQQWYNPTGQVELAETTVDGDIVVTFRTRLGAEQALAQGSDIPSIGRVQISWFTGQPSATSDQQDALQVSSNNRTEAEVKEHSPMDEHPMSPQMQEEASNGWGGGDDGDGMGML